MNDLRPSIDTPLVATVVSALAPLFSALVPGGAGPPVVVLIAGWGAVGPQVLGLADPRSVTLISTVGLGFLFLMVGYESEPSMLREHSGRLAVVAWVISAVAALVVVGILQITGFVRAFVPVAIALTTT